MKYVIKKRGFKGKYITRDKIVADSMLEPGTVITCVDAGKPVMSYGCVYATEVDTSLQLQAPEEK